MGPFELKNFWSRNPTLFEKCQSTWRRPPATAAKGGRVTGPRDDKVAGNDKVAGILLHSPLPPVDSSSAARALGKTTKSQNRRPGGSVVLYILNGMKWSQANFMRLIEKPHQRQKRWIVERAVVLGQSSDPQIFFRFCNGGSAGRN